MNTKEKEMFGKEKWKKFFLFCAYRHLCHQCVFVCVRVCACVCKKKRKMKRFPAEQATVIGPVLPKGDNCACKLGHFVKGRFCSIRLKLKPFLEWFVTFANCDILQKNCKFPWNISLCDLDVEEHATQYVSSLEALIKCCSLWNVWLTCFSQTMTRLCYKRLPLPAKLRLILILTAQVFSFAEGNVGRWRQIEMKYRHWPMCAIR